MPTWKLISYRRICIYKKKHCIKDHLLVANVPDLRVFIEYLLLGIYVLLEDCKRFHNTTVDIIEKST